MKNSKKYMVLALVFAAISVFLFSEGGLTYIFRFPAIAGGSGGAKGLTINWLALPTSLLVVVFAVKSLRSKN
jgi:hypothetical protein